MSVHPAPGCDPEKLNHALRESLGLGEPNTNGNGQHNESVPVVSRNSLGNGVIGDVVFLTMTPGLACEMRRVVLKAVDHIREHGQHKHMLERRAVIAAYRGKVGFTAADLAARYALEHYNAERAGTLDLTEMGFDGEPETFVDWFSESAGGVHFEGGADFVSQADQRAQWIRKYQFNENGRAIVWPALEPSITNEAVDDPHRLARIHLAQYQRGDGSKLRFYRGEWLGWSDGAFRSIADSEVQSSLAATIKAEFDLMNSDDVASWEKSSAKTEG